MMRYPARRSCAFVFVCHRGRLEVESLLLAASLKRFARGELELVAVAPTPADLLGEPQRATLEALRRLGVRVEPVSNAILEERPTRDVAYLLTNKIVALRAPTIAEQIVLLDSDQICRREFPAGSVPQAPRRPQLNSLGSADVKTLLGTHVWHDGYAPRVRSHVMAHRVQQWHVPHESCRVPRPRVHFEAGQLAGAFEHSRRVEQELVALSETAQAVMHIHYEELTARMPAHWRDLQNFVGAPREAMPELRLVKIENRTLRQAIANYDDLKRHFRGSAWGAFFEE